MAFSDLLRARLIQALASPGAANELETAPSFGGPMKLSPADAITAFAGGGQSSATQLVQQINRVTTVATRGDSVKLPAATAGTWVVISQVGAQPMAVFPSTGDAINGQAANASVTQLPNSCDLYFCPVAGQWYVEVGVGFSGSLVTELYQDSITANAGGGQAGAFQLTSEVNRITTVATAGDSVKLPASAPGLGIVVANHGANAMQVFGSGTDTINDVATATGVSQMKGSVCLYFCVGAGAWYVEGIGTGYAGSLQTFSFQDAMTAHAGGGQGSATAITTALARFTTVATAGDSSVLPAAAGGLSLTVINAGGQAMNVFPAGTDQINALGASVAYSLPAGQVLEIFSTVAGQWHTVQSPISVMPQTQYTSISSGNGTLTGAQFAGANDVTLITSGATALTTPTAAQILAAMPNMPVGASYRLRIVNTNAGTLTITADASVTATGTLTLATSTWRDWYVTITGATTATMKQIGTGTTS